MVSVYHHSIGDYTTVMLNPDNPNWVKALANRASKWNRYQTEKKWYDQAKALVALPIAYFTLVPLLGFLNAPEIIQLIAPGVFLLGYPFSVLICLRLADRDIPFLPHRAVKVLLGRFIQKALIHAECYVVVGKFLPSYRNRPESLVYRLVEEPVIDEFFEKRVQRKNKNLVKRYIKAFNSAISADIGVRKAFFQEYEYVNAYKDDRKDDCKDENKDGRENENDPESGLENENSGLQKRIEIDKTRAEDTYHLVSRGITDLLNEMELALNRVKKRTMDEATDLSWIA